MNLGRICGCGVARGLGILLLCRRISRRIKENFGSGKRGFGSIRVSANINDQTWKTSIFPDNKSEVYLLPVKAEVRKKADISADDTLKVTLELIL